MEIKIASSDPDDLSNDELLMQEIKHLNMAMKEIGITVPYSSLMNKRKIGKREGEKKEEILRASRRKW